MKILKDKRILNGSSIFIMDDYYAYYCPTIYGEEQPFYSTENYIDLDVVKNRGIRRVILHNKHTPVDILTSSNSILQRKNKEYDIEVLKLIARNADTISLIFADSDVAPPDGICGQIEYTYGILLNGKYKSENYILLIDEDNPSLDWLLID